MSHSTPAAMDELSAHPTMRVINNETLCWDEQLELYTWCKMPIFSVPVSKYERSASVIQGFSERWAPGCMKLGEKVAFCLPSAGRRMQLIHLSFT